MKAFPFPDRIGAREELKRDVLYHRIPGQDRIPACEAAWAAGVKAARDIIEKYGTLNIEEIQKSVGLTVERQDVDKISGNLRFFSEYEDRPKKIYLYTRSTAQFAKSNDLSVREAEELILAHEFYHYLECNVTGDTGKLYQVPRLQIGKLSLGKSGIRALSEIGAHGFARTYWENRYGAIYGSGKGTVQNASMEARLAQGKNEADHIMDVMFNRKKR